MPTIYVYGIVQGVGFRPTVYNTAKGLDLRGYVRNNGSNVEIVLENKVEKFLTELKKSLPPLARLDKVDIKDATPGYPHTDFVILKSEEGNRRSIIPTDTAICNDCIKEIFNQEDFRHNFFFTNCTCCGARYSLIDDLPFDRQRTSMIDFPMCRDCTQEYENPKNRRFHAQTISCPTCGPNYTFYDENKSILDGNPAQLLTEHLIRNKVGIVKSWGGMHIMSTFQAIPRLRKLYRRKAKPFAIMLKDIETVYRYCDPSEKELELLQSPQRPIVILQKNEKQKNPELDPISPGLGNLGVMLPYTPLHYLIFEKLPFDGLVATSANLPGEPMCISNESVFNLDLDFYLTHNRRILQRCDDSVLKVNSGKVFFIRKSRGYIPYPIDIPYNKSLVAVGAEMNVCAGISHEKRLFQTQFIGNTAKFLTSQYLKEAISHIRSLLGIDKLEGVALDLHPHYATRRIAIEIAKEENTNLMEIQHHWAHAVSLSVDNSIDDPIIALTIDGTGYGDDGEIWGGEILFSSPESYKRVASLEPLPLIGGDKAIYDPKRVVFAISELLGRENDYFEPKVADIFRKVMSKALMTTSLGRVLDAIACYLGVGMERTYDGEPAMKLETLLEKGKGKPWATERIKKGKRVIIQTLPIFEKLFSEKRQDTRNNANTAFSAVAGVVTELALTACEFAEEYGTKYVGVTGGVAYSRPIIELIKAVVTKNKLTILLHDKIAPGDGGISIGQNYILGTTFL